MQLDRVSGSWRRGGVSGTGGGFRRFCAGETDVQDAFRLINDSGTFDYFTEVIMGEAGVTRTDYAPSENDLDLVEGVASQRNALGYFGVSYYEQHIDRLRAVTIDSGSGCVMPDLQTIADGSYAPLSRPLFLYVSRASLARPEVQAFLHFALADIEDIVRTVAYMPLPAADYDDDRAELDAELAATPAP